MTTEEVTHAWDRLEEKYGVGDDLDWKAVRAGCEQSALLWNLPAAPLPPPEAPNSKP